MSALTTYKRPAWTVIAIATLALFLVSWLVEPQSVRAQLAAGDAALRRGPGDRRVGQTLVIQQGGIDLSVPG